MYESRRPSFLSVPRTASAPGWLPGAALVLQGVGDPGRLERHQRQRRRPVQVGDGLLDVSEAAPAVLVDRVGSDG